MTNASIVNIVAIVGLTLFLIGVTTVLVMAISIFRSLDGK